MTNATPLDTSLASNTDDYTPTIESIPPFHFFFEGGSIRVEHKPQEISLDDPSSTFMFLPIKKPFVVTAAVATAIPEAVVVACLHQLMWFADKHRGLDYLQSFTVQGSAESLWFIEDGDGGAITALFPSDY